MNNEDKILQMLEQMRFETNERFDKLESDMSEMKTEVKDIKTEIKDIKADIGELKTDVKYIKINQTEHSQLLNSIIHSQEVHKAEIDKLNIETAKLSGSIEGLRGDLSMVEQITSKNYSDISKLKAIK